MKTIDKNLSLQSINYLNSMSTYKYPANGPIRAAGICSGLFAAALVLAGLRAEVQPVPLPQTALAFTQGDQSGLDDVISQTGLDLVGGNEPNAGQPSEDVKLMARGPG